jgi:cysteine-rich repeat protein
MKGARKLLALLALSSACGGSSDSYSIVVVTVTAPSSLTGVTQLRAEITNAGRLDTELFPKGQPPTPLVFDASFALALPKSRVGELDIAVRALDRTGRVLATGSGSLQIVVGGRADVTIHLALYGEADAGPTDSEIAEAGPQDAELLGDSPTVDGYFGQDSQAYDGADGADVPLTGGAGGAAGGSGGRGGAGGVGGTDVGLGGSGGSVGIDAGIDRGGLGGSGGISPAGGAGGTGGTGGISSTGDAGSVDAGQDLAGGDGTGGISSTGGAGGTGGISSTGGVGGSGGTLASTDAGSPDAPPNACSSTLPCPSYSNCQGQPICNTATGLCSAPTLCSVCGNGIVELFEQCDDGNTISGDHCSSTCKYEFCGDGIVQSKTLASLSLVYLARSCGVVVAQDIWMVLNGTEVVRGTVRQTCDCAPGIVTLPVTNPLFLALGKNGPNIIEVHTPAEVSWAVAHYETPSGSGDVFLVDYGSNGAAQYRRPNLCTNGSYQGQEIGTTIVLTGGEQCDDGNSNGIGNDPCSITCTSM